MGHLLNAPAAHIELKKGEMVPERADAIRFGSADAARDGLRLEEPTVRNGGGLTRREAWFRFPMLGFRLRKVWWLDA